MPKLNTITLLTVKRPPGKANSIPVDPADWPAMRRYKSVLKQVQLGKSEADAVSQYDKPFGVCEVCGGEADLPKAIFCAAHRRERLIARCAAYRLAGGGQNERVCKREGCDAIFMGLAGVKYCALHRGGKGVPKPHKAPRVRKAKPVKPVKVMPDNWLAPKLSTRMPNMFVGTRVIVPAQEAAPINRGVKITQVPSLLKGTLRNPRTGTFWGLGE